MTADQQTGATEVENDTALVRRFGSLQELTARVGEEIGVSPWIVVDQYRIDEFAQATGDHQWIHVDPERAAEGPYGVTIAHGYLTLSLLPMLAGQIFSIGFGSARLNYGLNKVRFPNIVKVGSQVRARATLRGIESVATGTLLSVVYTVDVRDQSRPACVAESLVMVVTS